MSDLHLGKSERLARRGGGLLPPYETRDTLARLDADVLAVKPLTVICLGDSFDDDAARDALGQAEAEWLARMQAGRDWIWIAGNHDPAVTEAGGTIRAEVEIEGIMFRHIAAADAVNEISGHYHPKARLSVRGKWISRPCCLHDSQRAILPAYGTYTGGLGWLSEVFRPLLLPGARAILTGRVPQAVPLPQTARA